MRCPFCAAEDTQVRDSRSTEDGISIRRRRFCTACNSRFKTFERIQLADLTVIKKNGEKRPFDREKIRRSIVTAMRKESISEEDIEILINRIVMRFEATGESEIQTSSIGEAILRELINIDEVAYVRFASVYKEFETIEDFEKLIAQLKEEELELA